MQTITTHCHIDSPEALNGLRVVCGECCTPAHRIELREDGSCPNCDRWFGRFDRSDTAFQRECIERFNKPAAERGEWSEETRRKYMPNYKPTPKPMDPLAPTDLFEDATGDEVMGWDTEDIRDFCKWNDHNGDFDTFDSGEPLTRDDLCEIVEAWMNEGIL